MKKNFKEITTVKDMIANGFTVAHYEAPTCLLCGSEDISSVMKREYTHGLAELNLLIKYCCGLGMKPKKIKELIQDLWINYNPIYDYKVIDNMITRIKRKKDFKLIEVEEINIPEPIFDWLNNLVNNIQIDEIRREAISKSEIVKTLFTLYIWYELQKTYKEYGWDYICFDNFAKLKKASYLKQPTKCNNICFILKDNNIIDVDIKHKIVNGMVKSSYYQLRLNFVNEIPTEIISDDRLINITKLNELVPGKYYEEYFNLPDSRAKKEPLPTTCPCCGKPFERKSHRRDELCSECKKIKEREKDRLKKQKKREKIKKEKEAQK